MQPSFSVCWNCHTPVQEEHFCNHCEKIQPDRPGIDYFAFFGLPRRLNINLKDLEKRFYSLSRMLHPDNFYRSSDVERQFSLDKSAELNDAYRTLKDPVLRAEYLLSLEGQKTGSRQPPPELLEEVFEMNELLAEQKAAEQRAGGSEHLEELHRRLEGAKARFEERIANFRQELLALFGRWDAAADAGTLDRERPALLEELSAALAKRNYMRNLVRDVTAAMEERN